VCCVPGHLAGFWEYEDIPRLIEIINMLSAVLSLGPPSWLYPESDPSFFPQLILRIYQSTGSAALARRANRLLSKHVELLPNSIPFEPLWMAELTCNDPQRAVEVIGMVFRYVLSLQEPAQGFECAVSLLGFGVEPGARMCWSLQVFYVVCISV
jgi:hypothetical protein